MLEYSAAFFLSILLSFYVIFGFFEAITTPRLKWYKRLILIALWPIMYLAAWLDEREY
jgi:hypothetical protein